MIQGRNSYRALSTSRALATPPARDRTREIVAQAYLKLLTSVSSKKFAIIKVDGAILTEPEFFYELSHSLLFLNELGLYPVIPQFEEGIRVTDAKTLGVARKLFLEENPRLIDRLDELGVPARSISAAFIADYLDKDKWQYVGNITKVNKEAIENSIDAGYIPVLTSMAESEDGHLLNVNADVVYLSEKGGLFDGDGKHISHINLNAEFDHLMAQPWCRYGIRLNIKEIKELLDALPRTSSAAIIHPSDLQKELFTDSGAGTLLRRGMTISKASAIEEFEDLDKFKATLIRDREGMDAEATGDRFVGFLKANPFSAYYDDAMQCLAVVLPASGERPIATLATLNIAMSGWLSNIAENVFDAIKKDHPSLVWTVSGEDENLTWVFEKADRSFNKNGSVLFYYGCDLRSDALTRLRSAAQSTSKSLNASQGRT
ncbi:hypothetical protein EDB81DRAFT_864181 [Dactylonectria macrodidyma]|uniref:N-acetyltransferase domain-containing protein n=1 Tax=Dactylonectria macrodidyma TaxID=307937 RepID=A0A9P9FSQ6_9HYPO|nr:hypothetical protein EDB81DRAFT_864181 [Dactylonectria macrodidyma]